MPLCIFQERLQTKSVGECGLAIMIESRRTGKNVHLYSLYRPTKETGNNEWCNCHRCDSALFKQSRQNDSRQLCLGRWEHDRPKTTPDANAQHYSRTCRLSVDHATPISVSTTVQYSARNYDLSVIHSRWHQGRIQKRREGIRLKYI